MINLHIYIYIYASISFSTQHHSKNKAYLHMILQIRIMHQAKTMGRSELHVACKVRKFYFKAVDRKTHYSNTITLMHVYIYIYIHINRDRQLRQHVAQPRCSKIFSCKLLIVCTIDFVAADQFSKYIS